jgi:hypothetical protein
MDTHRPLLTGSLLVHCERRFALPGLRWLGLRSPWLADVDARSMHLLGARDRVLLHGLLQSLAAAVEGLAEVEEGRGPVGGRAAGSAAGGGKEGEGRRQQELWEEEEGEQGGWEGSSEHPTVQPTLLPAGAAAQWVDCGWEDEREAEQLGLFLGQPSQGPAQAAGSLQPDASWAGTQGASEGLAEGLEGPVESALAGPPEPVAGISLAEQLQVGCLRSLRMHS